MLLLPLPVLMLSLGSNSAAVDMTTLDTEQIGDALWYLRQAREQINHVKEDLVRNAPHAVQQVVCTM